MVLADVAEIEDTAKGFPEDRGGNGGDGWVWSSGDGGMFVCSGGGDVGGVGVRMC